MNIHLVVVIHPFHLSFRVGEQTGSQPHDGTLAGVEESLFTVSNAVYYDTREIIFNVL